MKEFIHAARQVLEGNRPVDERRKYQLIEFLLGLVHLMFVIYFVVLHVPIMVYYNIFIVIGYMSLVVVLQKTNAYFLVCALTFGEILVHSMLATILLGWDFGFMIYTVGLVPFAFYIGYTIPDFKHHILIPATTSLIVCICYFVVKVIADQHGALLDEDYTRNMIDLANYVNNVLNFLLLWAVAVLFALEINFMHKSLERENRSLERIANHDPLTHLLNRHSMNSYLKNAMKAAEKKKKPFCLIMADIDDFKKVNDTYGHGFGDEVLITVANILTENVRKEDYVCRWGGEEFLILIHAGEEIALQAANRICEDVAKSVVAQGDTKVSVTVTLGVSEYRLGDSIRRLVEKADDKLYEGKRTGKNRVVF